MKNLIKSIHKTLIKNGKTIATAESCTSGILASILTQLSGSSKYFTLGIITYSNQTKTKILKIPGSTIKKYGAVSREVASLMAKNVKRIAKADFGIGITGIAGPTGAIPNKPVGTVYIAVSDKNKTTCNKFIFRGNRSSIRKQSALKALQSLKLVLKKRGQIYFS
jgi:nicotinamide-nucleotide amidase